MTDAAALRPNLPERCRAKIDRVYGDRRRTFSAAIPFVRTDAKMILEGLRNAVGQFFGAGHNEAQASEILGGAAAGVGIQERRRGEQHGDRVFVDKRPDDARIEGIRMKNDADAGGRGQTKRPRKSERVKERKNSHDAVFRMEHENLIELLHVRSNIVCVRITPFGSPVEPLENIIVAMSSRDAVRSQPANFARAFAGKRPAASAAATRSPKPVSLATSSIKITSPGGWILTFSRNFRAVTTVFKLHCCAHEDSVSFETV